MKEGVERDEESRVVVEVVELVEIVGRGVQCWCQESGRDDVEGPAKDVVADEDRRLKETG